MLDRRGSLYLSLYALQYFFPLIFLIFHSDKKYSRFNNPINPHMSLRDLGAGYFCRDSTWLSVGLTPSCVNFRLNISISFSPNFNLAGLKKARYFMTCMNAVFS